MHFSRDTPWVVRWKYEMAAEATRPGIWRLREGGFFVRARVMDPRTGREVDKSRVLRGEGISVREALRVQDQLRVERRERAQGKTRSRMLWSEYAASLFEAKVADGTILSAASRRRWADTLARLVPRFGRYAVDDLRPADFVEWRNDIARWILNGMPSRREREKGKLVSLSPVTANGWISILKVVCGAMTKHFDLERDPSRSLEYFATPRTYTMEEPNSLSREQVPLFLAKMKAMHPSHYAMTFLGFILGARPSTLRPLRRDGSSPDVLWDQGIVVLRRSNSLGEEVMDWTKTKLDQSIALPPSAMRVLRAHVASLPRGPMKKSFFLFPSTTGGMRSRSALDKPFRDVLKALGWSLHLTPKGMRRTFNDLAREARVHDVVLRAISGHQTERMQELYSTARHAEIREALGKVVSIATARQKRASQRGEAPLGRSTARKTSDPA